MSNWKPPDYRTVLAISCLILSSCRPMGSSSSPTPAQGGDQSSGLSAQTPAPAGHSRALTVAEKAEIYALAARTDPRELRASIEHARREPERSRRELLVNALIERLGELDPVQAIDVATSMEQTFGLDLLEPLVASVVKADPDSAIDALAKLKARHGIEIVHRLATIVLEEIRDDSRLLDAWLQAVPAQESQGGYLPDLRAQGFSVLAEADPDLVMNRILTMSDRELRDLGIYRNRVADSLARHDARKALARIEVARDDKLRATMRYQLLRSWASREPMAALMYLAALDTWDDVPNLARDYALRSLAEQALSAGLDPLQVLALSRQMPPDRAGDVRYAALEALAQRDPIAAGAHLDEIPADKRLGIATTIAYLYADIDPTAAFLWAQQQDAPGLEQHVLTRVARNNAGLALDFALNRSVRSRANALTTVITEAVRFHPEAAPGLAERLAQSLAGSALYEGAMSTLASEWIQRDIEGAMSWLAAPGAKLPGTAYQAAARTTRNAARAAASTERIPAEARPLWIEQVASNYVRTDLEAAVAWIEQNRNDPYFALGAVAIVDSVARFDTSQATRLFAALPPTTDRRQVERAAAGLSAIWAQSDPAAAANWAAGLRDDALRKQVVTRVVVTWSQRDPDAARSWILGQTANRDRDNLLQAHLLVTGQKQLPDTAPSSPGR
jgi:hypothetical protein